MTPAEIVKSLRCCAEIGECEKCPIDAEATWDDCRKRDVEAADMIERLTAENAALREKQRWIPVEEKTPEYDMPYLALNADEDALIANYAYGEWFDTWGQDVEVTHWLPLPEKGGKA